MKNPTTNRFIGYIILFIGFVLFYKGFHSPTPEDPVNGHSSLLIVLGFIFVVLSFIFMILKVRCPHCNSLLNFKLTNIDVCPYCHKSTHE